MRRDSLFPVLKGVQHGREECIIWPYSPGERYPTIRYNGRKGVRVHSLACEWENGPRPQGKVAAHTCGNSRCVNQKHLRWASQKENVADKVQHGTARFGENCLSAKLTWSVVDEIRRAHVKGSHRFGSAALARQYGVSPQVVQAVVGNRSWKEETRDL